MQPNFKIESQFAGKVVGVDEAGRGPLVGPVVAASIILPSPEIVKDLNDSKKLSKKKREGLFKELTENCNYGVGIATVLEIEELNILQATFLAMRRSLENIKSDYAAVIVDGNQDPYKKTRNNITTVVKGDSKSLTIAAASIIAKVTRDHLMQELHEEFPEYNWIKNNGYGTKEHVAAINKYGCTKHHRKLFLRKILMA